MYERFTDRSRKVLQLAQQEAQRFNHEYVGTQHILLGLVKEGAGVAANVLKNLDVDLRKIRLEVEKVVRPDPGGDQVVLGKLPHTPRSKKVIELAVEGARELGHNYVGTEHLLLGLMREGEGVAAQVLMSLGLTPDTVVNELMALLGYEPEAAGETPEVKALKGRIEKLVAEKELACCHQDFQLASQIRDQERELRAELREAERDGRNRPLVWRPAVAPAAADQETLKKVTLALMMHLTGEWPADRTLAEVRRVTRPEAG